MQSDNMNALRWEPITRQPPRWMWDEPIIVVRAHGKAYFSLKAEELFGFPEKVVFLRAGETLALRLATPEDDPDVVRTLDPGRSISAPQSILKPGRYRVREAGEVFVLTPAPDARRKKSRHTRNGSTQQSATRLDKPVVDRRPQAETAVR